jgi:hypothetical protein
MRHALRFDDVYDNSLENQIDFIEKFDRGCGRTDVVISDGVKYFINDFWTSRQRQAARLHEVSYRACFKPQLPEFFISCLSSKGDHVYDPFMGRGTTPIQAALMERVAFGSDINPLSEMLARPRLDPPKLSDISRRLEEIPWGESPHVADTDLLGFYHPDTLAQIYALRKWFLLRTEEGLFDKVDNWVRMVALNRLSGHSPGFFSVYTLPPNQAVSAERQRKINEQRNQVPPRRNVPAIILKKSKSLLSERPVGKNIGNHKLWTGPAHKAPDIPAASIDLIVTSPPFLDVVQYAADNWLRCWFAGIDPAAVPISMHRTIESWTDFVTRCFREFARLVRPGGFVAFEVGEVRGGRILLEKHVIEAVQGLPFDLLGVVVNQQDFTKTSNCWGVGNNLKGTNSNRIVLLRRL